MKILMSGASGFVGSALTGFLRTCGHQVIRLVRDESLVTVDSIFWDPAKGILDPNAIEGFDAVINLAGESVVGGRWTTHRKELIVNSRVQATKLLAETMAKLVNPPKTFISASAVGYYGDRCNKVSTEDTAAGQGFLASVCQQWEAATAPAEKKGIRTIHMRMSMVLSPKGGALRKMLIPFKLGLGGRLGGGEHYMSWIALDDLSAGVLFLLNNPSIEGVVNMTSPTPVTNAEFTRTLGKVVRRSTVFSTPAWVLKLILGAEMTNDFLLCSLRVEPERLTKAGYTFLYPDLLCALKHLLKY